MKASKRIHDGYRLPMALLVFVMAWSFAWGIATAMNEGWFIFSIYLVLFTWASWTLHGQWLDWRIREGWHELETREKRAAVEAMRKRRH